MAESTRKRSIDGGASPSRTRARTAESAPNLSGTWKLDKERSEPLDPYLKAMDLCQIAIDGHHQKEATTDTFYTMSQTASSFKQSKESWSGSSSRDLDFDKPFHETGSTQMTRVITASVADNAVVITTEITTDKGKRSTLKDVRSLGDDGASIRMDLELKTPKETVTLTRWLVKSEPPKPAAKEEDDDEDDED